MKMLPSFVLAGVTGVLLCAGCSVKEDRGKCPCALVLDFSEVDTAVIRSADLFVADDAGLLFEDTLIPADFRESYILKVPRKSVMLGIWNADGLPSVGNGLAIPYGEDCPEVYFHTSVVDADAETVRETVRMHKNHCVMTVRIAWDEPGLEGIVLIGNVNGYHSDGLPSEGDFLYRLEQDGEGECRAVLPRQKDDSLVLEVNDGSGVAKRFSLGEYIARSGYDWNEPDLKDITIELDIAFLQVHLTVQGWDMTHRFDIVI